MFKLQRLEISGFKSFADHTEIVFTGSPPLLLHWIAPANLLLRKKLIYRITDVDIPVDTGDFRLMDRQVVNALNAMREHNRFIRGLTSWIGFRQTGVYYVRQERFAGETKYPLKKMVRFALDAITGFSIFQVPAKPGSTVKASPGFMVTGLPPSGVMVICPSIRCTNS